MLDEQGMQTFFNDVHRLWVEPELERRREEGLIEDAFRIRQCLILLPKSQPPIVRFNSEVNWQARAKTAPGGEFVKDAPVHLQQVECFETVEPPMVDDARVAFVFLFWDGRGLKILFDFTPNAPSQDYASEADGEWELGKSIAAYYNQILRELTLHNHDVVKEEVGKIGLWPAPALLPFPMSAICEHCRSGDNAAARKLLVDHCRPAFLAGLVEKWQQVPAFIDRATVWKEALNAHENKMFTLSISALIPQIEGVLTDWISGELPPGEVPHRQESKTKRWRDVITIAQQVTYIDQRIASAVVEFMLGGPLLDTFNDWLAPISLDFPNRHVVGHGRYDPGLYTEENSIKVFLLLDTIYRVVSNTQKATELR